MNFIDRNLCLQGYVHVAQGRQVHLADHVCENGNYSGFKCCGNVVCTCMCLCVGVRQRERERVCVCVCVCMLYRSNSAAMGIRSLFSWGKCSCLRKKSCSNSCSNRCRRFFSARRSALFLIVSALFTVSAIFAAAVCCCCADMFTQIHIHCHTKLKYTYSVTLNILKISL